MMKSMCAQQRFSSLIKILTGSFLKAKDAQFLFVDNENSDQVDLNFSSGARQKVRFLALRLKSYQHYYDIKKKKGAANGGEVKGVFS